MLLSNKDLPYVIALSRLEQIGPVRFSRLKNYFSSFHDAWNADSASLIQAGIEEHIALAIQSGKKVIDPESEIQRLEKEGVSVMVAGETEYPSILSEIHDPPPFLFYRGTVPKESFVGLGVVGTRKITHYGKAITPGIVGDCARAGFTIVSGLAFGVDACAHMSALESGGRTIAVLGCGVDRWSVYPTLHRALAEKIIEDGGFLVSEYPIGTPPFQQHFPARNRIISGLSVGVLVVEAGEKSGALITARYALDQNRDVFAIPGDITSPFSVGSNQLIKQGATVVVTSNDIIESYPDHFPHRKQKQSIAFKDDIEKKIFHSLSHEPLHVDFIGERCQLDTATVNSTLLIMEMKGFVKNRGNMCYVRV